jgi:SAM-dependent methyltransferase
MGTGTMGAGVLGAEALGATFVRVPAPVALREALPSHRMGALRSLALRGLSAVTGLYDASAMLDAYRMVLLDRAGFAALLEGLPRRTLLDVGAGAGDVHLELAACFDRAVATETSRATAARARGRGIDCLDLDLATESWPDDARFDVVALLNVLDRTERPLTLLDRALARVSDGGVLLLATPLPMQPHVQRAGGTADPEEWLATDGDDFEAALVGLVERVLAPRGLEVLRWTRTPYASSGDPVVPCYELDDALLVCRPAHVVSASASAPRPSAR